MTPTMPLLMVPLIQEYTGIMAEGIILLLEMPDNYVLFIKVLTKPLLCFFISLLLAVLDI